MNRLSLILVPALMALAACETGPPTRGAEGIYRINPGNTVAIQDRMLESVNYLRQGVGAPPLQMNAQLTSAAETHAGEMSGQNRAWPFSADGSSPYDRVQRAGYSGELIGEVYAQTYETELETLSKWVEDGAWGEEILNPDATDMGFGWKQDRNGLIWWAITLGTRDLSAQF